MAERIIAELNSRLNFMERHEACGLDTTMLEAAQIAKLCALIARTPLSPDDGAKITECFVNAGLSLASEQAMWGFGV